ncbi:MAG: peptide chain release factor 1 [Opitutales bacterium]
MPPSALSGLPALAPFRRRRDELDAAMQDPDFFADPRRAATLSREHQKLSRLIDQYAALESADRQRAEAQAILADEGADEQMRELAEAEVADLESKIQSLRDRVLMLMVPPEATDDRNIVVEIRAGAGGDEASLFAGSLFRMYSRYAEMRGWTKELLSVSESEAGGFKEVIFMLKGEEAYRHLKYESGVHRVQRVPVTESQGRIHTSTATVAVLPEAQEVDVQIDPADLEISVARASGPGGQGVNTTDSAVQILHKPTGMLVFCADERSQLKNKTKALTVLRSRLLKLKQEEERAKEAAHRKSQVGTGDRSERIRTYNFPQSRMTDHRINFTTHNLDGLMDGELDEVLEALEKADLQSRIDNLLAETAG